MILIVQPGVRPLLRVEVGIRQNAKVRSITDERHIDSVLQGCRARTPGMQSPYSRDAEPVLGLIIRRVGRDRVHNRGLAHRADHIPRSTGEFRLRQQPARLLQYITPPRPASSD